MTSSIMFTDPFHAPGRLLRRIGLVTPGGRGDSSHKREASLIPARDANTHAPYSDEGSISDARCETSYGSVLAITPETVLFTCRAYTAMLAEVLEKTPLETGGILLGYRDGSEWTVVESLDPGPDSIHQLAFFEYDQPYVTHLVNRVRNYYERPLDLLGLWHRHPGSFDSFSGTDDATNLDFAGTNPSGAISCLVNVDPKQRLTVFHVSSNPFAYTPLRYDVLGVEESLRRAPLRDIEALVTAIESERGYDSLRLRAASSVPTVAKVGLTSLAHRVNDAIRHYEGAVALDLGKLPVWSEDQLVDALAVLDTDLKGLERLGFTVNLRLADSTRLVLAAAREREEQEICQFFLAPLAANAQDAFFIASATNPAVAMQYVPAFLWTCATEQRFDH